MSSLAVSKGEATSLLRTTKNTVKVPTDDPRENGSSETKLVSEDQTIIIITWGIHHSNIMVNIGRGNMKGDIIASISIILY